MRMDLLTTACTMQQVAKPVLCFSLIRCNELGRLLSLISLIRFDSARMSG